MVIVLRCVKLRRVGKCTLNTKAPLEPANRKAQTLKPNRLYSPNLGQLLGHARRHLSSVASDRLRAYELLEFYQSKIFEHLPCAAFQVRIAFFCKRHVLHIILAM